MKKQFYFILLISLFNISLFSQEDATWTYSSKHIKDDIFEIRLKASVPAKSHLYSKEYKMNPTSIDFEKSSNYSLVGSFVEYPKPYKVYDDLLSDWEVYFKSNPTFIQRIKAKNNKNFSIKGKITYQICYESGMCNTFNKNFDVNIQASKIKLDTEKIEEVVKDTSSATEDTTETADVYTLKKGEYPLTPIIAKEHIYEKQEKDKSLLGFFLAALLGGLLALLTPCVYPMIPMTVAFFMKNEKKSKRKALSEVIFYGFSIMFIFVFIGTVVAMTMGATFSSWLSTHWVPNVFFFLLFIVFAFSFLGAFEITLPSWLVNSSDKKSDKGGYFGSFFMALTLVLVSFSCTAPIVGSILTLSAGGAFIKPIIGMLGFSVSFTVVFSLLAMFPTALKSMPKSGGWLNSVKVVIGLLELALAFKFLSVADQTYHWNLLNRDVYIGIWIVISIILGVYLLGKISFSHDSEVKKVNVFRTMLAIFVFSFVIYLVPGLFGAPLRALSGWLPPMASHNFNLLGKIEGLKPSNKICHDSPMFSEGDLHLPHNLKGYYYYTEALECAKEQNKPIFVDFTGHGCVNCREMEANVWSDVKVLKILKEKYIILSLFVDDKVIKVPEKYWFKSRKDGKIKKKLGEQNADIQIVNFQQTSQPLYALIDTNGRVLAEPRNYDLDVEEYIEFLEIGLRNYKK